MFRLFQIIIPRQCLDFGGIKMGMKATVPDRKYLIQKIHPDSNGYKTKTTYFGSLRLKPKGWRVIKEI